MKSAMMPIFSMILLIVLFYFFYDPTLTAFLITVTLSLWWSNNLLSQKVIGKKWSQKKRLAMQWGIWLIGFLLLAFVIIYDAADLYNGGWKERVKSYFYGFKNTFALKYHGHFLLVAACLLSVGFVRKRKYLVPTILFGLSFATLLVYKAAFDYIKNTGDEAFLEMQSFTLQHALGFASTIKGNLSFNIKIITSLLAVGFALSILFIINHTLHFYPKSKIPLRVFYYFIIALLIYIPFDRLYSRAIKSFITNRDFFQNLDEKYPDALPPFRTTRAGLQMVVYIGEASSLLHWSLYGYYRPTTPQIEKLSQDKGFLLFHNIFSPHTHTGPTLLNVFTFRPLQQNAFIPIEAQQRIPLTSLLLDSNIGNQYITTQDDRMSAFRILAWTVFKNMQRQADDNLYDHEFLLPWLKKKTKIFTADNNNIIWLHSIAGHTPYPRLIPNYAVRAVDKQLKNRPITDIIKTNQKKSLINTIENYDAAMRYVDDTVAKAVLEIIHSSQPIIFIYFSDHGDAADFNLGHDSSRFRHEMARVPFFIFFNQTARQTHPDLFLKYKDLALQSKKNISLLNQLPYTIVDIFGGDAKQYKNIIDSKPLLGEKSTWFEPILVRQTGNGLTYVNINPSPFTNSPQGSIDQTDPDTRFFLQNFYGGKQCYRAIDIRSAIVGAIVAPCLLVDKNMPSQNKKLFNTIKTIVDKNNITIEWAK
ncbi:MAG: sulfatase-like hydrolase/transferase [Alphaproteobacteria bacterium]